MHLYTLGRKATIGSKRFIGGTESHHFDYDNSPEVDEVNDIIDSGNSKDADPATLNNRLNNDDSTYQDIAAVSNDFDDKRMNVLLDKLSDNDSGIYDKSQYQSPTNFGTLDKRNTESEVIANKSDDVVDKPEMLLANSTHEDYGEPYKAQHFNYSMDNEAILRKHNETLEDGATLGNIFGEKHNITVFDKSTDEDSGGAMKLREDTTMTKDNSNIAAIDKDSNFAAENSNAILGKTSNSNFGSTDNIQDENYEFGGVDKIQQLNSGDNNETLFNDNFEDEDKATTSNDLRQQDNTEGDEGNLSEYITEFENMSTTNNESHNEDKANVYNESTVSNKMFSDSSTNTENLSLVDQIFHAPINSVLLNNSIRSPNQTNSYNPETLATDTILPSNRFVDKHNTSEFDNLTMQAQQNFTDNNKTYNKLHNFVQNLVFLDKSIYLIEHITGKSNITSNKSTNNAPRNKSINRNKHKVLDDKTKHSYTNNTNMSVYQTSNKENGNLTAGIAMKVGLLDSATKPINNRTGMNSEIEKFHANMDELISHCLSFDMDGNQSSITNISMSSNESSGKRGEVAVRLHTPNGDFVLSCRGLNNAHIPAYNFSESMNNSNVDRKETSLDFPTKSKHKSKKHAQYKNKKQMKIVDQIVTINALSANNSEGNVTKTDLYNSTSSAVPSGKHKFHKIGKHYGMKDKNNRSQLHIAAKSIVNYHFVDTEKVRNLLNDVVNFDKSAISWLYKHGYSKKSKDHGSDENNNKKASEVNIVENSKHDYLTSSSNKLLGKIPAADNKKSHSKLKNKIIARENINIQSSKSKMCNPIHRRNTRVKMPSKPAYRSHKKNHGRTSSNSGKRSSSCDQSTSSKVHRIKVLSDKRYKGVHLLKAVEIPAKVQSYLGGYHLLKDLDESSYNKNTNFTNYPYSSDQENFDYEGGDNDQNGGKKQAVDHYNYGGNQRNDIYNIDKTLPEYNPNVRRISSQVVHKDPYKIHLPDTGYQTTYKEQAVRRPLTLLNSTNSDGLAAYDNIDKLPTNNAPIALTGRLDDNKHNQVHLFTGPSVNVDVDDNNLN